MRINIAAPLCPTGVGIHGQYLIDELLQMEREFDLEIQIFPQGPVVHSISEDVRDRIAARLISQGDPKPADVTLALKLPQAYVRNAQPPAKRHVVWTYFETSTFPGVENLKQADQVWVASEWGATTLYDNGIERGVAVAPAGVRVEIDLSFMQSSRFPILVNVGKFEKRKGHLLLLEMLPKLERSVILNALWHNPWDKDGAKNALLGAGYEQSTPDSWIKDEVILNLIPSVTWHHEVQTWIADSDLAVFPHFGEGFGLGCLEAIALGVPTVASMHSGSADFVGDYYGMTNLHPFQAYEYKPAHDGIFFDREKHGVWMEMDEGTCLPVLADALDKAASGKLDTRLAGTRVAIDYSWRRSAERAVELCAGLLME